MSTSGYEVCWYNMRKICDYVSYFMSMPGYLAVFWYNMSKTSDYISYFMSISGYVVLRYNMTKKRDS